MLNKITISLLLCIPMFGISSSFANQSLPDSVESTIKKDYGLRFNMKYVNSIKTPNIVFNETYKSYVTDFENRFEKAQKTINDYNRTQDLKLKPLDLKIEQIKKNFDDEASDAYLNNLIDTEVKNFSSTINTITKNKLSNQETVVNTTFPDESKVFVSIFQKTLSDYEVTKEEKTYLETTMKEFVTVLKKNPITSPSDAYKKTLESINTNPNSYTLFEYYQKAMFNDKIATFDKALFDVMWSKSRSNSVYPDYKK
jgi:hypothetical protein